ncbi:hypothetical protein BaRGS_00014947 [Batillaria attramentaria]|uniref:Uncharacterized protein n=1 Tax=Batillaria attramentaria TaxID=370345 RepID=A0ABD0L3H8_9CAEN
MDPSCLGYTPIDSKLFHIWAEEEASHPSTKMTRPRLWKNIKLIHSHPSISIEDSPKLGRRNTSAHGLDSGLGRFVKKKALPTTPAESGRLQNALKEEIPDPSVPIMDSTKPRKKSLPTTPRNRKWTPPKT